jgi:predicted enzyme related to lactoylglutathione lyase
MTGNLVHFELPYGNTAKGSEFWGGVFGWEFSDPMGVDYLMADIGQGAGAAIEKVDDGRRGARAYFDVDDIGQSIARVRELGGEAGEQMPVPGRGWFAHCTDPHGNPFGLWQTDESASM